MKLTTSSITTGTVNCNSRIAKLGIVGTHATALSTANMRLITLEVKSTHPSYGTKTVIFPTPLLDLMEIAACNEGAMRLTPTQIFGAIELSEDGALVPLENESYQITISNNTYSINFDLYAIDVVKNASTKKEYLPVAVQANAPTPVNTINAEWLAVDKTTLVQLDIEYSSGQRITYLKAELDQVVSDVNELALIYVASATSGVVNMAGLNLYVLPVDEAIRVYVTASSITNAYVVNVKPV
jgi:hypothetical protein